MPFHEFLFRNRGKKPFFSYLSLIFKENLHVCALCERRSDAGVQKY